MFLFMRYFVQAQVFCPKLSFQINRNLSGNFVRLLECLEHWQGYARRILLSTDSCGSRYLASLDYLPNSTLTNDPPTASYFYPSLHSIFALLAQRFSYGYLAIRLLLSRVFAKLLTATRISFCLTTGGAYFCASKFQNQENQ